MIFLILLFVIIGDIITQNYSNNFFDCLESDLKNLKNEIRKDEKNKNVLMQEINDIKSDWSNHFNVLAYYTEHDELEKIENKIWRIYAGIEVDRYDEATVEVEECEFLIKHIKNKERFKLVNIF